MAKNFQKAERNVKIDGEYKLLSYASSSESVEMTDGTDLQTKMNSVDSDISNEVSRATVKENEIASNLSSHTSNTSNPHSVTKAQVGLGNVENKSSATIRGEITKSNVTTALGYTPYTPNEVDNKFSALETNIDWKESVATYNDITTTYPNPVDGWTVNVKDTDYTYRYNGTSWVAISANAIPKATNSVDGLLSKEDHTNYEDANSKKHTHSNKSVIDGISSTNVSNWNSAKTHADSTHARTDATKVEKSSTNGNIKINGTETTVYTHPSGTNPHGTTKSDVGLGNVGNFKAVSTVASQGLSDTEKSNARANIGAGTSSFSGSYNDLTNKPTIPTNNNQLTNGAGYITSSGTAKTISDTLPVSKGGTGQTTGINAANTLINSLSTGESTPTDADYYISQYVGGGTTTTTYHRRPMSALWNYIKSKLATVATSGSYNDLSNKPTIGNGTVTIKQAGTSKGTFTMNQSGNTTIELTDNNTTYSSKSAASGGTDVSLVTTGEKYTWNNKANASHGNHVPATQTANNAVFLRNDNTWQTVTPANIGAAASSHTHSAYVNQNAFSNITVGSTTVSADSATDTLTLVAGSNVTITPDATNDKITIAATDTVTTATTTGSGNAVTAITASNGALTVTKGATFLTAHQDISGKMNKSNPTGTGSFSLNRKSGSTIGDYSFVEGYSAVASGSYSHAEGSDTLASGNYSHAEGYYTTASGIYSHAEGYCTAANGDYSHAEGYYTTANGDYQHVQGKFNVTDTTSAFIIGNGTYGSARSNAMTVDWNGNVKIAGDITNGSGVSLNSLNSKIASLLNPVKILHTAYITTTNETSYACNWSSYKYLIVGAGNYGNYQDTQIVPTEYFKGTGSGTRIQLNINSHWIDVYQKDNSNVYIKSTNGASYYSVKIWGVLSV